MVFLKAILRCGALFVLAIAAPCSAAAQTSSPTLENDIKAAFLYNFTKFVEWPAPADPHETFRVCALADATFTAALDRTITGESVEGRPLVRLAPASIQDVRHCNILYVGRGYTDQGAPLLTAVRDLPVLTVGESPQFLRRGGAIGFVLDNNRVRFDISMRAVQRSGLKASSKLLRVARSVEGGAE